MSGLISKLHSRRGASMLVALLFFLICAMVASVVIMSASANNDRTSGRRQEQQAYLAVASAYEFLRDDMEAGSLVYTGSESHVVFECHQLLSDPRETLENVIDNGVSYGGFPPGCYARCNEGGATAPFATLTAPDCLIGGLLASMAEEISRTTTVYTPPEAEKASVSRAFTIDGEGLPQVTVTLTMYGAGDSCYDTDVSLEADGSAYSLHFRLDGGSAAVSVTTAEVTPPVNGHSHTVSYPAELEGGSWGTVTKTYDSVEKLNTRTTRVEWAIGAAGKGGV